jgi:amidase
MSNGAYLPPPQTLHQQQVAARIDERADAAAARLGMSRRRFLQTTGGLAGGLLAMNDVCGQFFRVAAAEAGAPMQTSELWRASAHELVDALRAKAVSSREVIEAHLARIAAVNPTVNAVTLVLAEEALAAADAADAAQAAGQPLPPLHGVPFTVKENIDLAGTPTTHGVVAFAGRVPDEDAPPIAQLKAAGAIPIGRTNMPDFALRWHTDNALHGATRNPWDAARSPGGSSGGDAVAVATGMAALGVGGDYGGSLRVPAQWCGTVALRTTQGRVATAGALAPQDPTLTRQLFAVAGPMARQVADLRLALAAMSGPSPRDPGWVPAPLQGPAPPRPVRVAVTVDPGGLGVDAAVAAGVQRAADALVDAGYDVAEVEPPAVAEGAALYAQLIGAEVRLNQAATEAIASPDLVRVLRLLVDVVPALDLEGYAAGFMARNGIARAWSLFQADTPLVLGPVATILPPPVGFDVAGPEQMRALLRAVRLTVLVNLLGLPAVAVPVGLAAGLPQGVQIIGPRFREDLCLDAAQAIEDRLGVLTPIDPRA